MSKPFQELAQKLRVAANYPFSSCLEESLPKVMSPLLAQVARQIAPNIALDLMRVLRKELMNPNEKQPAASIPRQKVYAFMNLPYHRQVERAQNLGVYEDTDANLADADKLLLWVKRAKARGIANELLTGASTPQHKPECASLWIPDNDGYSGSYGYDCDCGASTPVEAHRKKELSQADQVALDNALEAAQCGTPVEAPQSFTAINSAQNRPIPANLAEQPSAPRSQPVYEAACKIMNRVYHQKTERTDIEDILRHYFGSSDSPRSAAPTGEDFERAAREAVGCSSNPAHYDGFQAGWDAALKHANSLPEQPRSAAGVTLESIIDKVVRVIENRHGSVDISLLVKDAGEESQYWPVTMAFRETIDRRFAASEIKAAVRIALEAYHAAASAEGIQEKKD